MSEPSTLLGVDDESKAMLDLAAPDLYRVNVFRVLGLHVDVSSGELAKRQKKMKMLEKLGEDCRVTSAIFPLHPPPSEDDIRKAGQRLQDPESRLVHELLWFWPAEYGKNSDRDSEIDLLRHNDLVSAHRQWTLLLEQHGRNRSVAAHNLAVLHHAIALDNERILSQAKHPEPKATARLAKHWELALKHWTAVVEDDVLWDHVLGRIHELDDPRLTAGVARSLRRTLPVLLVTISVGLAVSSARRGDADGARQHVVLASRFDSRRVGAVLDREVAPLVDQIRQTCEQTSEKSQADPGHAAELAQQLMNDVKPLLSSIYDLLDQNHHLRESACDAVAQTIRACMIDFGNSTEAWERCAAFLKQALDLAVSDGLRGQLQEDIDHVEEQLCQKREFESLKRAVTGDQVYEITLTKRTASSANMLPGAGKGFRAIVPGVCACCLGEPSGEQTVSRGWEETRGLTRYQRTLSFAFPICAQCRQHQAEYFRKRWLLAILAAGGSVGIAYLVASQMNAVGWPTFVLAGAVLTSVFLLVCSTFIRLSILANKHACRDTAVEMSSASDLHVTFCFHNPLYASAFAEANHAVAFPRRYTKPPRGWHLLRGRAAVFAVVVSLVLGGIGHSIIYLSMEDEGNRKTPVTSQDHTPRTGGSDPQRSPSDGYSSPRQSPSTYAYSFLSTQIDLGKARATAMESEIEQMDSRLDSFSNRIKRCKQEIEGYERQSRLGIQVNESLYQQALDDHNALVDQFNSLLTERKTKCVEYSREIDSVNDLVRRYNSGER